MTTIEHRPVAESATDGPLIAGFGDNGSGEDCAPYFAPNEIAPSAGRATTYLKVRGAQIRREFVDRVGDGRKFEDIMTAASDWNGGRSLFLTWRDKVAGPLNAAYPLFLALIAGGPRALNLALDHPSLRGRKRRPSKNNPALIALLIVTKPHDEIERKACSAYAWVLTIAAMDATKPADFAEKLAGRTLKCCKQAVNTRMKWPLPDEAESSQITKAKPNAPQASAVSTGQIAEEVPSAKIPMPVAPETRQSENLEVSSARSGGSPRHLKAVLPEALEGPLADLVNMRCYVAGWVRLTKDQELYLEIDDLFGEADFPDDEAGDAAGATSPSNSPAGSDA